MRVAVVDIGTNSTRLLVADVEPDGDGGGRITELDRRSTVTRLGQGVDATGRLADEAIERVVAVLTEYRAAIDEHGAERDRRRPHERRPRRRERRRVPARACATTSASTRARSPATRRHA